MKNVAELIAALDILLEKDRLKVFEDEDVRRWLQSSPLVRTSKDLVSLLNIFPSEHRWKFITEVLGKEMLIEKFLTEADKAAISEVLNTCFVDVRSISIFGARKAVTTISSL